MNWRQWGNLNVTAALVPAVFLTVRECNMSSSMSKASEFVSVMKPSLLIYGKNRFFARYGSWFDPEHLLLGSGKDGGALLS